VYRPYPESRTEVRSTLGIGDAPIIIFVGGFLPWHDVKGLLEAFVLVLQHARARV